MKAGILRKAIYGLCLGFLIVGVSSSVDTNVQGSDLLTVCAAGPPVCTSSSLQEAAAIAADGSTIFVDPGVYSGPVIVAKNLTIIGSGSEQTVITQGLIAAGPFAVTARGLQVTAGLNGVQAQAAPGLPEIFSPVLSLDGVKITGNAGNGVAAFNNSTILMNDVEISQNGLTIRGQPVGSGVAARGSSTISISGNSRIQLSGANGISAADNSSLSISGSTIIEMSQLSGIQLGGSASASITGLTAQANGCFGVDVADNSTATITEGTYAGNAVAGIKVGGPSSTLIGCGTNTDPEVNATATIQNSIITGNPIGIQVGDFSKVFEQASLTTIGVVYIGNGANLVVDPEGEKSVSQN